MYTRAQKESSSVSSTSIHRKSNGSDGERSFSVQRQQEINSSQEKERPSYSRNAADLLAANVMRSMEARQQGEEAQGHKRQEEQGAASVAQVVMPKLELPIAPVASVFRPSGEMAIGRQCSACQQAREEGKDSDEMSSVAGIQTKLTVGAVGDRYEQEADRVAAQVMRMSLAPDNSPQVQRFGEEDNPVQRWSLAQSITPVVHRRVDEQVQMRELVQRAFQTGGKQASGDLESRLNASKGGGSPLAPEVRAFMEPRFGADFSGVRVHTGTEAVQMNRELGAQAFAHGSDVYFGAGKSPGNNELTAHELTHVVQQNSAAVQRLSLSSETHLQRSPVSVLAKQGAKVAAKKAIKEFIENQIKSRLKQYMSKQFAKQFVKDADDILNILDSSWWEIGLELIPIAGDIYGVGSFAQKLDKLWERVRFLEKKVQLVTTAASKSIKEITLSSKLTGKGKDKVEAFTNKVNRLSEHLTEDDLAGAAKDILGDPVIIGGKKYNHLQEVNDALKGLGNQLDQLKDGIKKSEFEGDALEEANRLLSTVSKQKDEIQNVLIKVQNGI